MREFKDFLQSKRKELKLTQSGLAERLNISDKTISKWETGRSYPDITLLGTLAKVLETDVNNLISCDDFQKVENIEKSNSIEINKYKTIMIIAISLLFSFVFKIISDSTYGTDSYQVMISIGLTLMAIGYATSIILVITSTIKFKSFYQDKYYQKNYNITLYNYLLTYIQTILAILLVVPITFIYGWIRYEQITTYHNGLLESNITVDNIGEPRIWIMYLVLTLLLFVLIPISILFKKKHLCKIKKDIPNLILLGISLVFFIFGFIFSLMKQDAYTLLFIPTFLVNIVITRRIIYVD